MNIAFARHLRRESTLVEKILWINLRNRRMRGLKFRRQCPIGPYVGDFVCLDKKIVLEFDGPHHKEQASYDQHRDEWLRNEGFKVFRMTNEEFLGNENMAMDKIRSFLGTV